MFDTGARQQAVAFSATTRVYPTLPPMSGPSAFAHTARRSLSSAKMVPALVAIGSIGYGVAAYKHAQDDKYHAQSVEMERSETERRRRDTVLMDAYGDKGSLEDLEKAIALYEAQQKR